MSTILWSFGRGSKLGRWKSLVSGCLMNWLQIRKLSFWRAVFFYSTQWAILQSDCDVWWNQDFVWQPMTTSSWLDWEEDPKNFSKPNSHAKKVMVTVWWSAVVWSTTAFRILAKLLHLRSMLSKSMRCNKNSNVCSRHQSTEMAQFFSMTTPDCTLHNWCFKTWSNWATKFCFIRHILLTSCQSTTISLSIFDNFSQGKWFHNHRRQKMLSKSSSNPKAQIFIF